MKRAVLFLSLLFGLGVGEASNAAERRVCYVTETQVGGHDRGRMLRAVPCKRKEPKSSASTGSTR